MTEKEAQRIIRDAAITLVNLDYLGDEARAELAHALGVTSFVAAPTTESKES